jgi:type IV pilus assembly protein PilC
MPYSYQAIDASGQQVSDIVDAGSMTEAADQLRQRGLFVTQMSPTDTAPIAAAPTAKAGGSTRDLVFFTQQMAMLLRAGARVVPALEAIEAQSTRPQWRTVVRSIRDQVEQGRPLSETLQEFPKVFSSVFVNIIAAGEASGDIALAFDRVARLAQQQRDIRNRVVGAMTYPAVLLGLCFIVILILLTFILPRFDEMFKALDVELPFITSTLITASQGLLRYWYVALSVVAVIGGGTYVFACSQIGKEFMSRGMVRVPVFGAIVRRVILARICRIWGQLIESKIPMLEAIQLAQHSTSSLDFRELLQEIEETVNRGESVAQPLRNSWLVPTTFAAAIATGEESGRMGSSLDFVATCLEEDNAQILASLSRVIEPIMLIVMGIVVGTMALSLFLPMFDMATVKG